MIDVGCRYGTYGRAQNKSEHGGWKKEEGEREEVGGSGGTGGAMARGYNNSTMYR